MDYFRYHSTNCFFLKSTRSDDLLAIDAGWPCTLYEYQRRMKERGLKYSNIKWAIVTHFHMDHAGLISDFIETGINCYMFENQEYADIDEMEIIIRKNYRTYKPIEKDKIIPLTTNDVREYFGKNGIRIDIIKTIGHSKDSISLLFEDEAIIGDLTPIHQLMDDDMKSKESWELIKNKNIKKIYPSHAEIFKL
ncbi:MAG TPA: MBL fold metallo-hydrolase [Rectinemataceae bacterium]|nr:MBL fold metallo-hydrolase [Rectinemataceae bacterium]